MRETNKQTKKKQQKKKKQKKNKKNKKKKKKTLICYTMTSNIRLTSVDNDAQMDLMLTRLYVFSN